MAAVLDVSTPEPAQRIAMDGRAQVARLEWRRQNSKSGKGSPDVTDGVTSLTTVPAKCRRKLLPVAHRWAPLGPLSMPEYQCRARCYTTILDRGGRKGRSNPNG